MIGFPFDATRPIYQLSEGIFASWLVITSLWLILGRTRLSLRILPQIGIVGMISLIGLLCIGLQNPRVWELVIATVLLCLWLTIVFVPFRFMGYRFVFVQPLEPPVTGQIQPVEKLTRGAIPMRDLFLLTTVLAGMCALGRLAPPGLQLTVENGYRFIRPGIRHHLHGTSRGPLSVGALTTLNRGLSACLRLPWWEC